MPPHVTKLENAFKLGLLAGECKGHTCEATTLSNAEALVGRSITSKQLSGMAAVLREIDQAQSLMDRVRGFLSFANILWCAFTPLPPTARARSIVASAACSRSRSTHHQHGCAQQCLCG